MAEKVAQQIIFKTAKGMRDIGPVQERQRRRIFQIITECFGRHGAQPLDTPVCEKRELLLGKYGEDSKLIYDLADQGGELLSLRYDLTVPFARYLCQNKIKAMKRYQIAKVYRRDNPSVTKGRFREFWQCDVDLAGNCGLMWYDAECLQILCKILTKIELPHKFIIKINHREVLNAMFRVAGVPLDKFKTICSSVDKLDKMSWDEVKNEMCVVKGLDEGVANNIGTYVSMSGDALLIDELLSSALGQDKDGKKGLDEMKILFELAKDLDISQYLRFDLSLARGLDYYTGLIFEAVVDGDVEVGSIAAGGRYDNLVSDLLGNQNFNVPCVGLSVGVERIFAILESLNEPVEPHVHCYIGSIGKDARVHRFRIAENLRESGLDVNMIPKDSVKPMELYQACEKDNVPISIFFGSKEISAEKPFVKVRTISTRSEEDVPIDELAAHLKNRLGLSKSQ